LTIVLVLVTSIAASTWDDQLAGATPTQCVDRYASSTLIEDAKALLDGVIDVGVFRPVRLGTDLDWTEDPFNDANWRFRLHSMRWPEALREAFLASGDQEYLAAWRRFWLDWQADNPIDDPPTDASWGDHPTGLRAKTLACALQEHPNQTWIAPLLRRHAQLLADDEFYVGQGNHALNQAQGLLAAGCVLDVPPWIRLGLDRIDPLAEESIDAAGATNEGAVAYAVYNYERYAETMNRITGCGARAPEHLRERLPRLARFIAHATLPNGEIPLIGDSNVKHPQRWYGPEVAYAVTSGAEGTEPSNRSVIYENGGWAFGRTTWDAPILPNAVHYTLRTGHGSRIHSHDDHGQLSIFGFGRRLLEDSGLHRYQSRLNNYFYRAVAHNGILLRDGTYRRIVGSQIRYARRTDGFDVFELELPVWKGVRWTRRVLFARDPGWFIVDDQVRAARPRTFTQVWHLAPNLDPHVRDGVLTTDVGRGNLSIRFLGRRPELAVIKGRRDPMQGFMAIKYGDLLPTTVLEATRRGTAARFVTLLSTSAAPGPVIARRVAVNSTEIRARVIHEGRTDVLRWGREAVTLTCADGC
jgi:hypothetical protein